MAGLPLVSRTMTNFFCVDELHAAAPSIRTSSGMIMTERYSAVLLSLHRLPQCGAEVMATEDHWQVQAWREKTVFEVLTP